MLFFWEKRNALAWLSIIITSVQGGGGIYMCPVNNLISRKKLQPDPRWTSPSLGKVGCSQLRAFLNRKKLLFLR